MRDDVNEPTRTVERDPVCGMTVDPERAAAQSEHNGKTFHFCCQSCATKFAAEPEKYIGASAASAHRNDFIVPLAGIDSSKAVSTRQEPRSKQKMCARGSPPQGTGRAPGSPRRVPEMRYGARACRTRSTSISRRVHLSDASGNRSSGSRLLPDLRHGARTS